MAAVEKTVGKAAEKTAKVVKEVALETADIATDVAGDVVETASHVKPGGVNLNGTTKGQQIGILVGTLLVGAAAGGGLTYVLANKHLRMKYEIIAAKEIADAKSFYARLHKTDDNDEVLTPQQVLEDKLGKDAVDALRGYSGPDPDGPFASEEELEQIREARASTSRERKDEGGVTVTTKDGEVVSHNIFADAAANDEWDYERELKIREENPTKPYIISSEEFLEGETGYGQTELTYYQGDDVLSDNQDVPVQNVNDVVGEDNLTRFGHGSNDPKMVYIRNDNTEMEYEVALSTGEYTREVLGLVEVDESDKELKHSHSRPPKKFRERDFE